MFIFFKAYMWRYVSIADVFKDCIKQYVPGVDLTKVLGMNIGIANPMGLNIEVLVTEVSGSTR